MNNSSLEIIKHNRFASVIYNYVLRKYVMQTFYLKVIKSIFYRLQMGLLNNATVLTNLNQQPFLCPFSHKMLFYQKAFPLYDRQLPKLCLYMSKQLNKSLSIIDVGANVGDSVLNIGITDAFYLCIEGDDSFSHYINTNLNKYNYSLERCFLSDNDSCLPYSLQSASGTGHLVEMDNSEKKTKLVSLDKLIEEKYSGIVFDLLKIDTDGFDFKVIRGAKHLLQTQHPLLFFEWDKAFLKEQGEDIISIYPILYDYGYTKCILFDNYGNLFNKVATNDYSTLKKHIGNTRAKGQPSYYDVLAIPETNVFNIEQLFLFFCDTKN